MNNNLQCYIDIWVFSLPLKIMTILKQKVKICTFTGLNSRGGEIHKILYYYLN